MNNQRGLAVLGIGTGIIVAAFLLSRKAKPPPGPAVEITGFRYVVDGAYDWGLYGLMTEGARVTHLSFVFRNNEAAPVEGVRVAMRVNGTDLGTPLDQFSAPISQPFTIPVGTNQIWFYFTPTLTHYITTAEVMVNGILAATASLEFDVEY